MNPPSGNSRALVQDYDAIVIGAGVSGSFLAHSLTARGLRCLMLEAGESFEKHTYPRSEIDANSRLYWSGGVEFTTTAEIGLLRPKVVGGGSIVNQALVDRFDDAALDPWREKSGADFFSTSRLAPWYEKAEAELAIQYIPAEYRNRNALIFEEGFKKNGFKCAPLRRAQRDCRYAEGNDCIECLAGCRVDSKQSMPVTVLKKARETGLLTLLDRFEVLGVSETSGWGYVSGRLRSGVEYRFRAPRVIFAGGAIGNSKILLQSGFDKSLPAIGTGFYTHPQYMNLAYYADPVRAHKGPFQAFKSDDAGFRAKGFKLENVFAPPVGLAMLFPGLGLEHHRRMRQIPHLACIEVAVRDTNPGIIRLGPQGTVKVTKQLDAEDLRRKRAGLDVVDAIFRSTGAKEIIPGRLAVGLHLMGGCPMGKDPKRSVVGPDFRLHGSEVFFAADSSIFPDAPGLNPSLTIMSLSLLAAEMIVTETGARAGAA